LLFKRSGKFDEEHLTCVVWSIITMPEGSTTTSTYTIDAPDTVHLVEFSPFEWSSQLLAIGTATRVTIGTCRFQVGPN